MSDASDHIENNHELLCGRLVVNGYMKIVIYLKLQFALLLPFHVCLTTISIIRKEPRSIKLL